MIELELIGGIPTNLGVQGVQVNKAGCDHFASRVYGLSCAGVAQVTDSGNASIADRNVRADRVGTRSVN